MNTNDWQQKLNENEGDFIRIPFDWDSNTPSSLMASYINFLLEQNRKEKYYRSYFEAIRKLYNNVKDSTSIEEQDIENKITLEWLNICYRTDDKNSNFYFATHPNKDLDREEEIEKILFPNEKETINDFFTNTADGRAYIRPLLDWFLNGYNLTTARKILDKITSEKLFSSVIKRILFPFSLLSFIPVLIFALFLALISSFCFKPTWHPEVLSILPLPCWSNQLYQRLEDTGISILDSPVPFILGIIYLVIILSILVYILHISRFNKKKLNKTTHYFPRLTHGLVYQWPRLWVPRLIGGIIVGYLPLILSHDVWRLALQFQLIHTVFILGLSLFLCWFYLRTTISETSYSNKKITQKTNHIFITGLFQSFFLGIIASDFLTLPVFNLILDSVSSLDIKSITVIWGVNGIIIPKIIFLFSPLAFLIGIFLQLLWEDKPLTQSL